MTRLNIKKYLRRYNILENLVLHSTTSSFLIMHQQRSNTRRNLISTSDEEAAAPVPAPRRRQLTKQQLQHALQIPNSETIKADILQEHDGNLYKALAAYDDVLATSAEPIDRVPPELSGFILELCETFNQDANTKYMAMELISQVLKLQAAPELQATPLFKFKVANESIGELAGGGGGGKGGGKGGGAAGRPSQTKSMLELNAVHRPLLASAVSTLIASKMVSASKAIRMKELEEHLNSRFGFNVHIQDLVACEMQMLDSIKYAFPPCPLTTYVQATHDFF